MTIPSHSHRPSLWSRLLILFLLEVAAALGIILLVQIRSGLPYLAMILLDSAGLGLVSGLGTRFLLKERHWALGTLAAVVALLSGFFILGLASGWHYGLGPQELKNFDLAGATQLATGLLASLLAATAWRKPVHQNQEPADTTQSQPQRSEKSERTESGVPVVQHKAKKTAGSQPKGRTRKTSIPAAPGNARLQKSPAEHPARSRLKRRPRRPEVQVASTEEHRCPYCLQIVQPNDPRGMVECKICHTLHHAGLLGHYRHLPGAALERMIITHRGKPHA